MVGKCGKKRDSNKIHSRTIFGRQLIEPEIFFLLRLQNVFNQKFCYNYSWATEAPKKIVTNNFVGINFAVEEKKFRDKLCVAQKWF